MTILFFPEVSFKIVRGIIFIKEKSNIFLLNHYIQCFFYLYLLLNLLPYFLEKSLPPNKHRNCDKKVNKRRPRISAGILMWCLFEEFRIIKKQLLSNLKHHWKCLFIKNDVVEKDCEKLSEDSTGKAV